MTLHPLVQRWDDEMTALVQKHWGADGIFNCENYIFYNGDDSDERTVEDISRIAYTDMNAAVSFMEEAETNVKELIDDLRNGRPGGRYRS